MNEDQATDLIEQLSNLRPSLSSSGDDGGGTNARQQALQLSRKLTASLEKPENVAVDLAFSHFMPVAARIAVDLHLFEHIVDHDGGGVTSGELANLSGGEELLIIRVLRPLSATGFVDEVGERTWGATAVSRAMATEGIAAGHRMIGEMIAAAANKAPKYLREAGYRCPTDARDGFMQYAFQSKLTTFELFGTMPRVLGDFNAFMGNTMGARDYWIDWFPVRERLVDGAATGGSSSAPLLVDVGAGKGHDLLAFHERYPGRGRLVLQDLAPVVEGIGDIEPAVELMTYDFFTEQPLKGARAYFYHHILHDWSDGKCLEILEQVRRAMRPGYSRLLLHEMIIPERGASTFHAMLDMTMMCFNAGMERTERQWRELLGKAGLQVVKVWSPRQEDADGIVEAMVSE